MGTPSRVATRGRDVSGVEAGSRPVVLATLGVPFDDAAAAFAVDAAVESGQRLVVANVVELAPLAMCANMRYELEDRPELAAALRAPAELARSLGVAVERLRVRSLRPIEALLELVAELEPGLLVFGPDRSRLRTRMYEKAARRIRERAPCLVWMS
jgi:hypothetical protein